MDQTTTQAIRLAAQKHGIPFEYLATMAGIESSYKPDSINKKTGACGLFQIMPSTARALGLSTTECVNPEKAADAAARYTLSNILALKRKGILIDLRSAPEFGYLAHQQGVYGLSEIIKAALNGEDVGPRIRRNMDRNGGSGKTPAQFLAYWRNKYQTIAAGFKL